MEPDEQDGFAASELVEEIRVRLIADILALIVACRELVKVLEENDAMALVMPEVWRQTLFLRALRDSKESLWRAMKNAERIKPKSGVVGPQQKAQK